MELGLLSAAEMVGFLLSGLPAGVWVDRLRRKPILVTIGLLRAVALASIPIAALFDALTLAQLYAVAVIVSIPLAPRVIARLGHGPTMYGAAVLMLPFFVLVAFTGPGWRLALFPIGMALVYLVAVMLNVAQSSYRQAICPQALRGRMNASLRFVMWGSLPLGGVVGGLLGEAVTVHPLLLIACLGTAAAHLPFALSPAVRKLKLKDDGAPADADVEGAGRT